MSKQAWGEAVTVEIADGVAWISLNRPGQAQRDQPGDRPRDDSGARRARGRPGGRGAGHHRRRRRLLGRPGPEGVFPRDRGLARARARAAVRPERRLAVAAADALFQADDRDGQRLVLWRRLSGADRLRPRHRRRGRHLRPQRDQLGHHPGRDRDQGGQHGDAAARRDVLHHDRRDLRRPAGRRDAPGQSRGPARAAAGRGRRARRRRCARRTRMSCAPPRPPTTMSARWAGSRRWNT